MRRSSASRKRRVGSSSVEVTELGLGCAPLGDAFERISEAAAQEVVDAAYRSGISYFDTAPWYGHGLSEHRLGYGLRQTSRADTVISTKVGRVYDRRRADSTYESRWAGGLPFVPRFDYTWDGIMRSYEDSLHRLGTDRVDLLVVHDLDYTYHATDAGVCRYWKELTDGGGWRALMELRSSGDVGAIGVGINERAMMRRFLEAFDIDFLLVAMPYTLLDQASLEDELELCRAKDVGLIIGSPYASGILATGAVPDTTYGYEPAPEDIQRRVRSITEVCALHDTPLGAVALQFPLGHPAVAAVIPGAKSAREVRDNVAMVSRQIPEQLWADLKAEGLLHPRAPVP